MFQPTFDEITQIFQAYYRIPLGHSRISSTILGWILHTFGNNFQVAFVFNLSLLTLAMIMVVSHLNFKSKIAQSLVLVIFILSPWAWQTAYSSTSICLVILGLAVLVVLEKHAILFWLFASLLSLLIYPTLHLPFLNVDSYNYFVNLHRQADLYNHQGLLARILYNRYVFAFRQVFVRLLSFFDWDRWVFVGSSGKAEVSPFTAMQFTLVEIPLILASFWNAIKNHKKLTTVFFVTAFLVSLSPIESNQAPFWFLVEVVLFYWFQTQQWLSKKNGFTLLGLVICLRLITTNYTLNYQTHHIQVLNVYKEMAQILSSDQYKGKDIVITDRIGQPHIYLTYLNLFSPEDLKNALSTTTTHDNLGLLQPSHIGKCKFASFTDDLKSDLDHVYPHSYLIEISRQFNNVTPIYKFTNPITIQKDKDSFTDNLIIVNKP